MTDPYPAGSQSPASNDPAQPAPPVPPAYGEYAPPAPPTAPTYGQQSAPAYQQPAYAGAPAYDPSAPGAGAAGAAVPGKTLGIVAFVLAFFVQVIALILGIVALVQSKKAGRSNGFALAAIIISSVLIVLGIILAAIFIPVIMESLDAATTCANDPNATVTILGQSVSCAEILEQSGR